MSTSFQCQQPLEQLPGQTVDNMQSKCRDSHHEWPHCETNDNVLSDYRSLPRWTSTTFFTWRKMLFSEWHRYTPRKRKMKTLATGFEPTNFQLELWTLYPWAIGDSCRGKLGHDTKSEVANFGLTVSMGLSICVAYADDDENEDGKFKPAWSFK